MTTPSPADGNDETCDPRHSSPATDLTRRQALAFLGATGAAALGGCNLNLTGATTTDTGNSGSTSGSDNLACILTPQQTEGPYFVDERLNRPDIRSDPNTGTVEQGIPLRLRINVAKVSGSVCSALAGATVDVWHCNAQGVYSDESVNGTSGKKFLRGYLVTDSDGTVEFTTIYPGWYSGRTVHIHFKIRTGSLEFTSQLYFDESVTAQVYSHSPYAARGLPNTSNARDGIFNAATLLTLTPDSDGYLGTFNVGVNTA